MTDILEEFGKHLRKVGLRKGISQEKRAELASLHRTYVSSGERDKRNISMVNICRLAKALEIKVRDLMPKM